MYKTSSGFVFEANTVCVGNQFLTGIKEEYSVGGGSTIRVRATFGVDINIMPTKPAYLQQGYKFVGLSDLLLDGNPAEGMSRFLRSNRAVYTLVPVTYLICNVTGEIDRATGAWLNNTTVTFYTPKSIVRLDDASNGQHKRGVLCEQLALHKGLHLIEANPQYLSMISQAILSRVNPAIRAKDTFLSARAGVSV